MAAARDIAETVDDYIAMFPDAVQEILQEIRATIREAVPDAVETISYEIPTFAINNVAVIFFAAFRRHVGVYPMPLKKPEFSKALKPYASGKATAKFFYNKDIPYDLIAEVAKYLARDARARPKGKPKIPPAPPSVE